MFQKRYTEEWHKWRDTTKEYVLEELSRHYSKVAVMEKVGKMQADPERIIETPLVWFRWKEDEDE